MVKKIILGLLALIVLVLLSGFIYFKSLSPEYEGIKTFNDIKEETEILFDDYGIPHIYANNSHDAYFALGYTHAKERWFQMELLKRVGQGRLAEMFGKDLVDADKLFRSLGIMEHARKSIDLLDTESEYYKHTLDYINGFNAYIKEGDTPLEFTILGLEKEELTLEHMHAISGYMAFSFGMGLRTDPILEFIKINYGQDYLDEFVLDTHDGYLFNLPQEAPILDSSEFNGLAVSQILDDLPVPLFVGSNAWAVSGSKTKSGIPILCNDTHIRYAQPCTWYEAHIEYPGHSIYGNFLPGIPFALIGHTREGGWGITMLENDDSDFYREEIQEDRPDEYFHDNNWKPFKTRIEKIKVKDGEDVDYEVISTVHGGIVNEFLPTEFDQPISMFWSFMDHPNNLLEVFYEYNYATSYEDMEQASSMIAAPGLNVLYANKSGDIGMWACAKFPVREFEAHPKFFLEGNGTDDVDEYYDFKYNPKSKNPDSGYLYSSNHAYDSLNGVYHTGYYLPDNRATELEAFLGQSAKFGINEMKELSVWNRSIAEVLVCQDLLELLDQENLNEQQKEVLQILKNWDGNHELNAIAPTVYYKWVYHIYEKSMMDELGEDMFSGFISTHTIKRSYGCLLTSHDSPWWDNIETEEIEVRDQIINESFQLSIEELNEQMGPKIESWKWEKVHFTEFGHAMGQVKPLDRIFNVGPYPSPGGHETVNNASFEMNSDNLYYASYGPQMRIIIDFADVENSLSVLPTGQSGVPSSPHYSDQAEMYINGQFRKMLMNEDEIRANSKKLILRPNN